MSETASRRWSDASRRAWISAGAPILVLVLVVIMLATAVVAGFARKQDQEFARDSSRFVASALDGRARALSNLTLDYGMWNDAYENVTQRWDASWLDDNYYTAVADGLVVFRADGALRYLWMSPELAEAGAGLAPATMRAALDNMALPRADSALPADLVKQSLFSHNGRLVLLSVAVVSPEDEEGRRTRTGEADYVAIVDVLQPVEFAEIGAGLDLIGLAYAPSDPGPGRIALPLGEASGRPLGALTWMDEKPGSAAFLGQIWPIILSLAIIGVLTALIARRLAASYVHTMAQAEAALEASRLKSEFIATMSHELRTPLNSIIGYAELIQEEAEPRGEHTIAEDAGRVLGAAKHLRRLVSDILDQSRIDAGRLQLSIERVAVAGVLADVVELASPLARANGDTLVATEATPGLEALADDMRIRQCLLNLIGNAAKLTAQGSIVVTARLDRRPEGDFIVFDVADTGMGLSREDVKHLFEPFAQAGAGKAEFRGSGLGLSIAHKLARAMGGDIAVESEVGRGSVFSLSIPAATERVREAA